MHFIMYLDNGGNNKSKRQLKNIDIIVQTLKKTCIIIFLNSC